MVRETLSVVRRSEFSPCASPCRLFTRFKVKETGERASASSDAAMVPLSVVVCLSLLALAGATDVKQCSGKSIENLNENVQLSPCNKLPCKLKKGTDQRITIAFKPEKDLVDVTNHVTAEVLPGIPVPFFGVDGNSICEKVYTPEGEKASCPLKAGSKYVYKDAFPVYEIYPNIETKVQWALTDGKEDIICFEVPVKIKK